MLITISQTIANPQIQVEGTNFVLRGFYSQRFLDSDNATIVESGNGRSGFYYEIACSIDGDGYLVIPQFEIHTTDDAIDVLTSRFTGQLFIDDVPSVVIFGFSTGTGWIIPSSLAPTTTWSELDVFNQGRVVTPFQPPTTLAEWAIIALIDSIPQGASGYSGFSGPSGYSGFSAYSGFSGYSGYSGISAYSGFSGPSGYSGYTGKSGFSGRSGYSGFSGYSGYSGISGFSAAVGVSGFSGFSGSGVSGYSGAGASGYSGYSGPSGYSGFSGPSGYSGYSGVSGFSGDNPGSSGYSGFTGISGYSGFSGGGGGGGLDLITIWALNG